MRSFRESSAGYGLPRDVAGLLGLLVVLLLGLQYTTLEKFSARSPGLSYQTFSRFAEEVDRRVDLGPADATLALATVALCLLLVWLELRRGRLTLFLRYCFSSDRRTLLLLTLGSPILVRFYLARGEPSWAGDAAQHISYAAITAQALLRGEIPVWTNHLGGGSPYLQFYGFLFFYLVGLVDLLCRDFYLSLKLALAGGHLLSGIGACLFARTLFRSRRVGFIAGIAYVLCFWHTQQVVVMGRLPLSLFYGLLPWPFLCFERLRGSRPRSAAAAGGLLLGLLVFTHPGYAFWATVLLAVYIAARLWEEREPRLLRGGILLLGLGLLFGAFLTLPMWVERGSTGLRGGYLLGGIPGPTWRHVLAWSNYRFWLFPFPAGEFHWYGGYLGLSLVGLALAGLAGLKRPGRSAGIVAGLLLSLLLAFAHHLPPLRYLSVVQAMPAGRYLLFVAFFLSLAAGGGARILLIRRGKGRGRLATLLILILLADLGPATFQHPYFFPTADPTGYPTDLFDRLRAAARPFRDRGELPNFRFLWAVGGLHPYMAIGRAQVATGIPTPYGPHPGDLLSVFEFTNPLERFLSSALADLKDPDALPDHEQFDLISGGLRLLDVKFALATQADGEIKTLRWSAHGPVLISPRIAGFPAKELAEFVERGEAEAFLRRTFPDQEDLALLKRIFPVLWIIQKSGVDLYGDRCASILLRDFEGKEDLAIAPTLALLEHRVLDQRVDLRLRVSEDCYARLAYSYFPHLVVEVDGRPVQPLRTAGHFIALRLEGGEHRIRLEPRLSPLRRWLLGLDAALLVAAIWIWTRERCRARRG